MNKEIIFFCPSIEDGGVEKNLFLIVNELSKNFNTSLITANANKKKEFNKEVNLVVPKIFKIDNSPRFLKSLYCLFLILWNFNHKKKIIISYESNIFAIIAAKLLKFPVIIRSNASPEGYLNNYFKKITFKFFFQFADIILVNSSEFKRKIDKILGIKSKIIYNSIIQKNLQQKLSSKKIKQYVLKKNCYKIIVVGRLVRQKDHMTLLKALKKLKNKINFFVLIIGKGVLEQNLKKYCFLNNLSKQIKFIGYKKNIYPYLKWTNALVLSSIYEGSPNVLIEAISMKKIVISSDCPTGPREILKNGKAGYLFKTSDFNDLASKIQESFIKKKNNKK